MNFKRHIWDEKAYKEFRSYLFLKKDAKYKEFHQGLFKEDFPFIGVRMPILRSIAKEISRGNAFSFLAFIKHDYYEEKMIHGLIIGYLHDSFDIVLSLLEEFLPFNDNWAINDSVASNLKIFKKNKERGFSFLLQKLNSKNPWDIRFALILLLHYYIDEEIDKVLSISNRIKNENYYVKMANAWLLSMCFIKKREETIQFLKTTTIDNFTYNKTISKICDSYQVSKKEKDVLKQMKRK